MVGARTAHHLASVAIAISLVRGSSLVARVPCVDYNALGLAAGMLHGARKLSASSSARLAPTVTLALNHLSADVLLRICLLNWLIKMHLSVNMVMVARQSRHLNVLHLLHVVMGRMPVVDTRALASEELLLVGGQYSGINLTRFRCGALTLRKLMLTKRFNLPLCTSL